MVDALALPEKPLPQDGEVSRTSNVRVCVRVRPCPAEETCMIRCTEKGDSLEVLKEGKSENYLKSQKTQRLGFAYDCVLGPAASQAEVYSETAEPMIAHVLTGKNATVFAYGATGSGKTHTVIGTPENPGILTHAIQDTFTAVAADPRPLTVHVSFMELYNEELRDLLHPDAPARQVGEDPKRKQIIVTGLTEREVHSEESALQALNLGLKRRQVDSTKANAQSSRSHAVLWLQLGEQGKKWRSRLALIDLAGSERAQKTQNEGKTAREGANINKSLLALANCINALTARSEKLAKKPESINFRDSKLTLLLKYSLLGDGLVTMVAAVHPGEFHVDEALNTLEYAGRARNIKVRTVPDEEETVALRAVTPAPRGRKRKSSEDGEHAPKRRQDDEPAAKRRLTGAGPSLRSRSVGVPLCDDDGSPRTSRRTFARSPEPFDRASTSLVDLRHEKIPRNPGRERVLQAHTVALTKEKTELLSRVRELTEAREAVEREAARLRRRLAAAEDAMALKDAHIAELVALEPKPQTDLLSLEP
jgi:hypothetical protein